MRIPRKEGEPWREGLKYLPAERVAELIRELPDGANLICNSVGNLSIMDKDMEYIGFIEFYKQGGICV